MDQAKVIVKPVHEGHVLLDIGKTITEESATQDDIAADTPLPCLKIVPQLDDSSLYQPPVNLEEPPTSLNPHLPNSPQYKPNQDDVLSVVIQKLTELVESSDNKKDSDKESVYSGCDTPKSNFDGTGENQLEQPKVKGKYKLFKCPNCPCLFSVTKAQLRRKVQPVCPCCVKSKSSQQLQVSKPVNQVLITCELCDAIFSNYSDVLLHLGTHANATIFKCRLCDFVTTQEKNILMHEKVHYAPSSQNKSFKCGQCNITVLDFAELQSHLKTHNENKELLMKCSDCGFTCQCEETLLKHMWQHIDSHSNLSNNQNQQCALSKTLPLSEETTSDMLCRIKGSVCPMQDGWHSQVSLYKCPLCSYICEKLSTLKCHVWRHAGDKKCAYPLIDDVESMKEAVIPVTNETNEKVDIDNTGQTQLVMGSFDTDKKCCEQQNETNCQCEAIHVPKDQYPIIKTIIDNPESISQSHSVPYEDFISESDHHIIKICEANNKNMSAMKPTQNNKELSGYDHALPTLSPTTDKNSLSNTNTVCSNDIATTAPDIFFDIDGDIITQNAEVVVGETIEIHVDNATDTQQLKMNDFVSVNLENKSDEDYNVTSSKSHSETLTVGQREAIDRVEQVDKQIDTLDVTLNKSQILESLLKTSIEETPVTEISEEEDCSGSSNDDQVEQLSVREEVVQSDPKLSLSTNESPQSEKTGISDSLLCVIETLVQRSNTDELNLNLKTKRKRKRHENESLDDTEFEKSSKKGFKCELCSYQTTSSGYMQRHMRYHIANEPNQCLFCKFQADDSEQLKIHMMKDCKKPIYSCKKCSAKFYYRSKLLAHMQTHATVFKCAQCSFETTSENDVEEHKLVHLHVTESPTPQCSTEIIEETNASRYICKECNMNLPNQDELETHVKIHMKPFKCQLCEYSSATANGVKNHMKFHIKDRPHKCPLCEFSGAYPQSLRAHMKTHMQEHNFSLPAANDVFQCKLCGYTCNHLPSLKSHMWKHASDPHFNYECTMSQIKRSKDNPGTKNKDKPCTDPPPKSDDNENAVPNEAEYVLLRYQCAQCGFVGTAKDTLITHIRTEHKESLQSISS